MLRWVWICMRVSSKLQSWRVCFFIWHGDNQHWKWWSRVVQSEPSNNVLPMQLQPLLPNRNIGHDGVQPILFQWCTLFPCGVHRVWDGAGDWVVQCPACLCVVQAPPSWPARAEVQLEGSDCFGHGDIPSWTTVGGRQVGRVTSVWPGFHRPLEMVAQRFGRKWTRCTDLLAPGFVHSFVPVRHQRPQWLQKQMLVLAFAARRRMSSICPELTRVVGKLFIFCQWSNWP